MESRVEIRFAIDSNRASLPCRELSDKDGTVFPYRNLLDHPEAIDEIPELFNEPYMKSLVSTINDTDGLFETVFIYF